MIKNVDAFAAEQDERNIYFAIDMCGGFIWRMNHDLANGRIEDPTGGIDRDIQQARQDQLAIVAALPRFGVSEPLKDGRPTDQYWRWFRWWDSWKKAMSNDEWRECDAAMSRGVTPEEDKRFRPSGDWRTPG